MHLLIQNPTVFKQFFFFEDYLVSRKLWWLFYFWEEKKCEIHFQNFVEMNFSVLIELVQAILPKSRKIIILFKNPMLLVYEKKNWLVFISCSLDLILTLLICTLHFKISSDNSSSFDFCFWLYLQFIFFTLWNPIFCKVGNLKKKFSFVQP